MQIRRAGDTMFLVELAATIEPLMNARAIALGGRLSARALPGVRDVVPGYASLGVHFDPLRTDLVALERALVEDAAAVATIDHVQSPREHAIEVEYGGRSGPDLEEVARLAGLSADEVVARHAGVTYRVYMLGFVPGFAYLGRLDPRIAAPRRRVPRERVPAGSVGIAGEQTGVYPLATPGGWQLIGRTEVVMFDPARDPACLLSPGDAVRFVPR